jgi:hypothetical protein
MGEREGKFSTFSIFFIKIKAIFENIVAFKLPMTVEKP